MPWSELHWAAFRNDVPGIKRLTDPAGGFCCRKSLHADITDLHGATPLHVAANAGQADAVNALLCSGDVTVDAKNSDGETPLHWVTKNKMTMTDVHNGHLMSVRLLLKHGANAEMGDKDRCTPLHSACNRGYLELVKMLLFEANAGKGANPNTQNKDNKSAKSIIESKNPKAPNVTAIKELFRRFETEGFAEGSTMPVSTEHTMTPPARRRGPELTRPAGVQP